MALDHQLVARKLLQARELQSLDLEEVGMAVGITASRINQIELGQAKPSGDEVLILANYYRHDFRDFLDESRPAPFEQIDILYRRHGDVFSPQDRRAIQEFLYLCEIEAVLEADIGDTKESFTFTPQGSRFKSHGEPAAKALRSLLGYASNEIPRDVFNDFRRIGIHLFRRRLASSDISGLYIEHPIAGHCVLVNYDEDIYRQRFSASHEAAHVIFDSSESVMVTFRQGTTFYKEGDLMEIRANRFASCYLMPPDQLPRIPQWTNEQAIKFAQQFRVSTTALSIALREAGIVDESTARSIRSVKVPFTEKIDPEAPANLSERQKASRLALLERGLSDYYVGLCFEAHQRGLISAGRLGEALLTDHAGMREISVLYGRSVRDGD
ncbi:MAG: XRE family transcriptional regulator [Gallionella sp.]|nr:XRE family transcriptional regulator [Gallionella sp.]